MNEHQGFARTFFSLGFRPFFLGAMVVAVVFMAIWMGAWAFHWPMAFAGLSPIQWHAHEMIYGYGMAVIAGFLLTAIKNWTGQQTASGVKLCCLFSLWLIGRLASLAPDSQFLIVLAGADFLFWALLFVEVFRPIAKVKQWRQAGVVSKVLLLGLGNCLFYCGVFGWVVDGVRLGLYGGLYLVIGLILTISRRVVPFFTERGVGYEVRLRNSDLVDRLAIVLFLVFFILELTKVAPLIAAATAMALFALHAYRLQGWLTVGVWKKPLLSILFVSYFLITVAFLLYAAGVFGKINPFLAVHAFTFGGIGLITFGMMARVSLGHTGRSVHQPLRAFPFLLIVLVFGVVSRVFLPIVSPEHYWAWMVLSQLCWIIAFSALLVIYFPILTKPNLKSNSLKIINS